MSLEFFKDFNSITGELCPRCNLHHSPGECPLGNKKFHKICLVCWWEHSTEKCPLNTKDTSDSVFHKICPRCRSEYSGPECEVCKVASDIKNYKI